MHPPKVLYDSQLWKMQFVLPMHAVDLELEKPDRFYVQDVWEVAEEASADVICRLEGTNLGDSRHNCHFLGVLSFHRLIVQPEHYSCLILQRLKKNYWKVSHHG